MVFLCCSFSVFAQRLDNGQTVSSSSSTIVKDTEPLRISAYNNKVVVENAPIGGKLEIYSVVGIRVKEIVIKQATAEYPVDIAKGYYIVRIGDTVRKIAIR